VDWNIADHLKAKTGALIGSNTASCPPAQPSVRPRSRETKVSVTIADECAGIGIGKPITRYLFTLSGANILKFWLTGRLKIYVRDAETVVIEISLPERLV
jgi:hypothetical protein